MHMELEGPCGRCFLLLDGFMLFSIVCRSSGRVELLPVWGLRVTAQSIKLATAGVSHQPCTASPLLLGLGLCRFLWSGLRLFCGVFAGLCSGTVVILFLLQNVGLHVPLSGSVKL